MGRRGRKRSPVQVRLDRLEEKHTSGLDDQGRRWKIRGAPVGALVEAIEEVLCGGGTSAVRRDLARRP